MGPRDSQSTFVFLAQSVFTAIGLLTVIVLGIRQIVGLVSRQTELSQVDEKIKKALRELWEVEVEMRDREAQDSSERAQSILADLEGTRARLGEKTAELESAVTAAGAAIIAADLGLSYGSFKLREIHEAEKALVKGLHHRWAAVLAPSLAALASAATSEEKERAIIRAATAITNAYGGAVLEAVKLGQEARRTAALLASLVPVTVMEAGAFSATTPSSGIVAAVFKRMDREGMPLRGDGLRSVAFLSEVNAPAGDGG